jgi:beta-galactosidase
MKNWTRRNWLKTSLLGPTLAAMAHQAGSQEKQPFRITGENPETTPFPAATSEASGSAVERERLLLDFGWRFHLGHADDPSKDFGFGGDRAGNFRKTGNFLPAGSLAFDDSTWRALDLPHDWAIELPFEKDPALASKGFYPLGRKYPETSVGWYRRVFELPSGDAGARISIEFDGAYRQSMVVFNGFYIGQHSGGYDPFSFDVTDFATPGGRNVLLVRVDATESDGWFYEGAGIYRHVWLVKTHPVHVKKWGTFVRTRLRGTEATILIRTEVQNQSLGPAPTRIISTILDPSGTEVAKATSEPVSIPESDDHTYEQEVTISKAALWSLEERNLYRLLTDVQVGDAIVDRHETRFGIRTVSFDSQRGFFLNERPVKLKGTCNHQDHAGLGAALPDAVQYYRIRKLQEMGCNAYRTSHNPPTPELLDACDELGMLVFDETRMMSSNPEGLGQFADLVRRDRNHPCVFLWSMGNEEGQANTEKGLHILNAMKRTAIEQDGSRLVSIAPIRAIGEGGLKVCDVMGYNYMDPEAEAYHEAHPDIPMMGTENVSAVGTRGIYVTDGQKGYVGSYDPYTTTGRASAEGWWKFANAHPWLAGGFVWTGFDYRGEPSPYEWPNISSQYGIIDTCGFPKDTFYYYQSWWTLQPVLHLFPHWNWPGRDGQEIAIWVYSNLDRVELFLNGRSLGAKQMNKDSHLAWVVKYSPGTLEARGYKDSKLVLTSRRETIGQAAKLVLKADGEEILANGEDVRMFAVEVEDTRGRIVPTADNRVAFRVSGEGKLIGVGNGDPTSHEPDKGTSRKAFSGLCMAIVQSTKNPGNITVEATSPGLAAASATVRSKSTRLRPQVAVWEREVPRGAGITGLWRPVPKTEENAILALFIASADMVFTFRQDGAKLTGTVEGSGGSFFGGSDTPLPITESNIEGNVISFKAGNTTYTGTLNGDQIELQRKIELPFRLPKISPGPPGSGPAIGPPPDGSDPSIPDARRLLARGPGPIVLHRVER